MLPIERSVRNGILFLMICMLSPSFAFLPDAHRPSRRRNNRPLPPLQESSADDKSSAVDGERLPLVITESDWKGTGLPREDLSPEDLPTLLMDALSLNDFPESDSGLHSMWAFAGDTTRYIFNHNKTDYIESVHETANQFPTSFYGNALNGQSWKMISPLNRVGGETGWLATQVMETVSSDGRLRRWQWELRKNRRPPNLNCWFVESIGSSDRKGQFEAE